MNNQINHLHERSLRIVHNEYEFSFQKLLELDHSISIHHRNILLLVIELFKVNNGLSNEIMHELFDMQTIEHSLCSETDFNLEQYISLTVVNGFSKILLQKFGYDTIGY